MKLFIILILLITSATSFSSSIRLTLEDASSSPQVTRMSCEGQTCSCPENTTLDRSSMQCLKCLAPEELNSRNRCSDPSLPHAVTIDHRFFTPEMVLKLNSQASVSPTICDITTMDKGHFTSCQCPSVVEKFSLGAKEKRSLAVLYERTFNPETQKCERKTRYAVGVQNISCFGPGESAFSGLAKLGVIDASYDAPEMSLETCGAQDGLHVLLLNRDENSGEMSILDAIHFITLGSSTYQGRRVTSFEIDPASLNY